MKSISVDQQAALRRPFGLPIMFIQIDWPDEATERLVTAGADMVWDSYTWEGVGDVLAVEPIVESESVEATGFRLYTSGVMQSQAARALLSVYSGAPITVWFAMLDPDTYALIDEPVKEWAGLLDACVVSDAPDSESDEVISSIHILAESRMATLLGAGTRRYTDADQQNFHSGDTFFKFVPQMAERLIVFPSAEAQR